AHSVAAVPRRDRTPRASRRLDRAMGRARPGDAGGVQRRGRREERWMTTAAANRATSPPNIVFVLIDDMGWRDLGCYGSTFYETPRIHALAQQGALFTDAYAAAPICSPTRASILSGKYPARVGMTQFV